MRLGLFDRFLIFFVILLKKKVNIYSIWKKTGKFDFLENYVYVYSLKVFQMFVRLSRIHIIKAQSS